MRLISHNGLPISFWDNVLLYQQPNIQAGITRTVRRGPKVPLSPIFQSGRTTRSRSTVLEGTLLDGTNAFEGVHEWVDL